MFYVYEIKLHIFQSLSHSIISLFENVSIENYYCLSFVEFTLCHSLLGKPRGDKFTFYPIFHHLS
jgi:hypothetical protein